MDYLNYNKPPSSDEVMGLFPIPLLVSSYTLDYTKELEWIKNCNYNKNSDISVNLDAKFTSRQSKDTFLLDRPELINIRSFIEEKLSYYVNNVLQSSSELVITQSWSNVNGKGEWHDEHTHPNSIVSGVFYLHNNDSLPPIKFKKKYSSEVNLDIEKYNMYNNNFVQYSFHNGDLILFPSSLQHSVPANLSDEERISLSFNTWAKGNLGDERSLTFLPLDRCV
tara:strand:+ start:101 stop:769 length:669 start_codon:yes stop_codon:yes gene_type:complete